MLVMYKKANMHTFLYRDVSVSAAAGVSSLCLVPGVNDVPDATWEIVKALPACKQMVEIGLLAEVAPALEDLKGKKLETAIAETLDERILDKFDDHDQRPEVKSAIRKQRELIAAKTAPSPK